MNDINYVQYLTQNNVEFIHSLIWMNLKKKFPYTILFFN